MTTFDYIRSTKWKFGRIEEGLQRKYGQYAQNIWRNQRYSKERRSWTQRCHFFFSFVVHYLKQIVTRTVSGKVLTGSDICLLFSIAILSDIANRNLQTWEELHLLNLALRFATTLAEKVSLQGLGGMVSEIIVRYEGGIAKAFVSIIIFTIAAAWVYLDVGLFFRWLNFKNQF